MKKSKLFLKSLVGIPFGIFTLEIINIILSVTYGKYTRIDCLNCGINLNNILYSYLYCAISSYIITVCLFNSINLNKSSLSIRERRKENNKLNLPLFISLFVFVFIKAIHIEEDFSIFGFFPSFIWTGLVMIITAVKTLFDRYSIKEINNKLKQTVINKK